MSKNYDIILEPYKGPSTRHTCPRCGQKKKFSLYIYTDTGDPVDPTVGRCDREVRCRYHYTPQRFFADNPNRSRKAHSTQYTKHTRSLYSTTNTHSSQQYALIKFLPLELLDKSVSLHPKSNLYPFLVKLFRENIAEYLCHKYCIGSNKDGNTVFWQKDIQGRARQAKIMQYDPKTGKRNKATGALFAGKIILNDNEANLQQCLFGEHLLSLEENFNKPVAITESEKTAIIASIYYPGFIWLATGGKAGCKWTDASVAKVLAKRKVILFPDLGVFDSWKGKGLLLAATVGCKVAISDILEKCSSYEEKETGLDIADYLLRTHDSSGLALTDYSYPVIWDLKN